jgi:membrane protein DedA with SNARE-associated domain
VSGVQAPFTRGPEDRGGERTTPSRVSAHVISFVAAHSVVAVFVLMAVDAVFPAASELVMLTAGALAVGAFGHGVAVFGASVATGAPAFAVLVAAGTLGYLAGALVGWAIGVRGGRALLARHGRWLHLGPDRLERAEHWFGRFGPSAVFVGRIVPVARSFVSVPAGVLGSPLGRYTALTFAGSLVWCAAFAGAGAAFGANYEQVHQTLGHAEVLAAGLVVVAVVVLVVRRRTKVSQPTSSGGRS